MKRFATVLIACMAAMAMNTSGAAPEAMSMARYFPEGPLLFVAAPRLSEFLPMLKKHAITDKYIGSEDDKRFRRSKLCLKLRNRVRDMEKLTGFGVSYDNFEEIAGGEAALALYDIFSLKMVFISAVSREKALKSRLWAAREKMEERRLGEQPYWAISDESGAALAFGIVGGRLVISNDIGLFERSLKLIAGPGETRSLANSALFKSALPKDFEQGDLTVVLNQRELNDDPYFKTYWVYNNVARLGWIKSETLDLRLGSTKRGEVIEERGWYRVEEGASGAPGRADLTNLVKWPGANWIDARQAGDSLEAARAIAEIMGETSPNSKKFVNDLNDLVGPSNPTAIARVDGSRKAGDGFWLDRKRVVAIGVENLEKLNKAAFLEALAARWSAQLAAGGLLKARFVNRGGIEILDLPLLDGVAPAVYVSGNLVAVSNDASLLKDYLAAGPAPGFQKNASRFTYADMDRGASALADYYRALASRSNWRRMDGEKFFGQQALALLETIGLIDRMTVNGAMRGGFYEQRSRFELVK